MSAPSSHSHSQSVSPTSSTSPRKWAWRAAAVAASATVALSLSAWAASEPAASAPPAADAAANCPAQDGRGGGHPGRHGHHHGMGAGMGHALDAGPGMMPFGGRHLQRMLDEAKATDAQRKQIEAIADQARADLQTLRTEGKKLHEQGLALWAAAKLDTKAIEAHRQQMLKHHDRMSARTTQAMFEASKVLSPAQRASVVQGLQTHQHGMLQRMKHRMGWGQGSPAPGDATAPASAAR